MNDKVQRVQIEPERIGWARLADLVRLKHTEKVTDMKEDIDTLLVFVSTFFLGPSLLLIALLGGFILRRNYRIYH